MKSFATAAAILSVASASALPPHEQCAAGQVWNSCGSACTPSCGDPYPFCTKQCVARCECAVSKSNGLKQVVNAEGVCVDQVQCAPTAEVFHTESFEQLPSDATYTLTPASFRVQRGSASEDIWGQFPTAGRAFTGYDGEKAIFAMDIDGYPRVRSPQGKIFMDVDISGWSNVEVTFSIGALTTNGGKFDEKDYVFVYATVDENERVKIGEFRNNGAKFNTPLFRKENGQVASPMLTQTMRDFTFSVPRCDLARNLGLEIVVSSNAAGEKLVIDNVRVSGVSAPVTYPLVISEEINQLDLLCDGGLGFQAVAVDLQDDAAIRDYLVGATAEAVNGDASQPFLSPEDFYVVNAVYTDVDFDGLQAFCTSSPLTSNLACTPLHQSFMLNYFFRTQDGQNSATNAENAKSLLEQAYEVMDEQVELGNMVVYTPPFEGNIETLFAYDKVNGVMAAYELSCG